MAITSRIQEYRIRNPVSMSKKIDQYLSEHLPDLMDEYRIADRNDVADLDIEFDGYEKRMSELEGWKKYFDIKLDDGARRIERLKLKFGMNGGGKK
ncbi:MAG: hypothetical protein JXA22_06055 [Candidatus Thermoplasmatota archaeon]|nr:hypothetical protein [Candidatus Thermoplasmatota archaeon]